MKIENEMLIFSTGKTIRVNCGSIGLDNDLYVSHGFDSTLSINDENDNDYLTKEEKVELADYMIKLWQRFKAQTEESLK